MELYEYARPELMSGKKILYVHGFASSGQNGTVNTMRLLLPEAEIIAPDLPVSPKEAVALLKSICDNEHLDLIIGTSMGAMMTEQLIGYDRILVNPAFHLADTILKNNGLGRQEFHSARNDGQTSFIVTKGLLEEFREVSSACFSNVSEGNVYGLFGINDTMVNCFDEFASHYRNAIRFDGEHYLNDSAFLHSVLPVIQWIDDCQQKKGKKVVLVAVENVLMDMRNEEPCNGAVKAFNRLSEAYETYIHSNLPPNEPETASKMQSWAYGHIGVRAWDRVLISSHKDMIMADYLIVPEGENVGDGFMGTVIRYGSEQFRGWDDIVTFFDRLGGQ